MIPAEQSAQAGRPILAVLLIGAGLGFAGYMIWSMIDYSGLYRWLADWQIAAFGSIFYGATVIGPIILVSCPLVAIGLAIIGNGRGRGAGCLWLLALIALAMLGLGGALMMRSAALPSLDDPVQPLDLANPKAADPVAAHVQLIGRADHAHALAIRWRGKTTTHEDVYTPIFGPEDGPVRFVAKTSSIDLQGRPKAVGDNPQGLLWPAALPNEARAGLERAGVRLAPTVHLLDTGFYDPVFNWILAILCASGGLAGLILLAVTARRKRD